MTMLALTLLGPLVAALVILTLRRAPEILALIGAARLASCCLSCRIYRSGLSLRRSPPPCRWSLLQ